MSSLSRHSGQRIIQHGFPKSRRGESARRYIRRAGSVGGMWGKRIRGEFSDMTICRVPRAWLPEKKSGRQKELRHFPWACWSRDMVSTLMTKVMPSLLSLPVVGVQRRIEDREHNHCIPKFTILWVQVARGSVEATEDLFNPTFSSLGTTLLIKISRYFVGIGSES